MDGEGIAGLCDDMEFLGESDMEFLGETGMEFGDSFILELGFVKMGSMVL